MDVTLSQGSRRVARDSGISAVFEGFRAGLRASGLWSRQGFRVLGFGA